MKFLKKIIIGLFAGTVTGLFGSGGGMILVPTFTFLLKLGEKESRATSIFCILPMVCVSSFFYFNSSYIEIETGVLCAVGGIIGGFIGAKLLKKLPDRYLRIFFTGFLIYVSIRLIIQGVS